MYRVRSGHCAMYELAFFTPVLTVVLDHPFRESMKTASLDKSQQI